MFTFVVKANGFGFFGHLRLGDGIQFQFLYIYFSYGYYLQQYGRIILKINSVMNINRKTRKPNVDCGLVVLIDFYHYFRPIFS